MKPSVLAVSTPTIGTSTSRLIRHFSLVARLDLLVPTSDVMLTAPSLVVAGLPGFFKVAPNRSLLPGSLPALVGVFRPNVSCRKFAWFASRGSAQRSSGPARLIIWRSDPSAIELETSAIRSRAALLWYEAGHIPHDVVSTRTPCFRFGSRHARAPIPAARPCAPGARCEGPWVGHGPCGTGRGNQQGCSAGCHRVGPMTECWRRELERRGSASATEGGIGSASPMLESPRRPDATCGRRPMRPHNPDLDPVRKARPNQSGPVLDAGDGVGEELVPKEAGGGEQRPLDDPVEGTVGGQDHVISAGLVPIENGGRNLRDRAATAVVQVGFGTRSAKIHDPVEPTKAGDSMRW